MNKLQAYFQLSLADFRERTRRSSFVVAILGILFFGYLVITGKYTIQFGEYRTLYDSSWAGHLMAVCSSIMLTIVGFYLVKGSIKRDRMTEVGQIIAATPMSKRSYIISKLISNVLVLGFMTAVLAGAAFLTLLIRNEAKGVDLVAFLIPFLTISLPATVFVASAAVLFDTVRWLRGSIGNIIYLFAAEMCLISALFGSPYFDLGAANLFSESIRTAAATAFPGETIPLIMGFVMFDPVMQVEATKMIPWDGIGWTFETLQLRVFWVALGLVLTGISIPIFDRFDPALARRKKTGKKSKKSVPADSSEAPGRHPGIAYSELLTPSVRFSMLRMAAAELRLAVKGYHWFWYLVAVGLVGAQVVAPFDIVRQYLVPLAMIWPVVIWSSMGTRESRHGTDQLLFSSPAPVNRQLPAVWISGLVVSLAAVSCMLVRALVMARPSYAAALVAGALLVPSAAVALGSLSKSKRPFEVLYIMIWYVGSIEHFSAIDLLGTTDEAITAGKLLFVGSISIFFLIVARVTRSAQLLRG